MAEEAKGLFGRVLEDVKTFFKLQFQAVWEDYTNIWPKAIANWFSITFSRTDRAALGKTGIFNLLVRIGVLRVEDADVLSQISSAMGMMQIPLEFLTALLLLKDQMNRIIDVTGSKAIQELNKKFSPYPPGAEALLRGLFIAPELSDKIIDRIKASGISEDDIKLMIVSSYATYAPDVIRVLYQRKVIDEAKMFERMRELGFTDTRIKEMVAGWPVIPGPQDLFWMVGKEAFEPAAIEMMGLGDEFPQEQVKWLEAQGVSREWALKYWYAHWDQPSIGQGFEMLHRGKIDLKALDMLFRTVEIPPFWREKLTAIAYNVYTRVDVRRMYQSGILSDQQVYENYLDLGYDHEHARNLTLWTIAEYQEENKELTRSQIMNAYQRRAISRAAAGKAIKAMGYTDDQTEFMLSLEDLKYEQSLQEDMIKNIEDRYVNNLIDKLDAQTQLSKLAMPGEQVRILIDRWDIKVYKDKKLPSKTDLGKWYLAKVINEDGYREQMKKLGYSFWQIDKYLEYTKKTKKAD